MLRNLFERWTENEMRVTVVCALLSAVSLALSLTGTFSGVLPADIAWVAIVLCGFPILLGAGAFTCCYQSEAGDKLQGLT